MNARDSASTVHSVPVWVPVLGVASCYGKVPVPYIGTGTAFCLFLCYCFLRSISYRYGYSAGDNPCVTLRPAYLFISPAKLLSTMVVLVQRAHLNSSSVLITSPAWPLPSAASALPVVPKAAFHLAGRLKPVRIRRGCPVLRIFVCAAWDSYRLPYFASPHAIVARRPTPGAWVAQLLLKLSQSSGLLRGCKRVANRPATWPPRSFLRGTAAARGRLSSTEICRTKRCGLLPRTGLKNAPARSTKLQQTRYVLLLTFANLIV